MWSHTTSTCRGADVSWEKPQSPEFTHPTVREPEELERSQWTQLHVGLLELLNRAHSHGPCSLLQHSCFQSPSPAQACFPILFHKRLKVISNRCVLYSGNSEIFPDDWLAQKLWLVAPKIASVTLHLTIRAEWTPNCRKRHHRRRNYSALKPQPGEK